MTPITTGMLLKPMPEREPSTEKELTPEKEPIPLDKSSSMTSLILWNVSKALEIEPCLDLKGSIRAAQQRLDSEERDLSFNSEEPPEQQYLVCALLAWQRLGHHDTDSLYRFVELKKKEIACAAKRVPKPDSKINAHQNPAVWNSVDGSFGSHTTGPIVTLPVESKIIMVLENKAGKKYTPKRPQKETLEKINAACCLDLNCAKKLADVDTMTRELSTRARQLARREAERVELLARAETAWKDLESGYQKRLALAEEKEIDIQKLMKKLVAERYAFKSSCVPLVNGLKIIGEAVEKERGNLTTLEQQVCSLANTKLRMVQEAAMGEAALAQELCKAAQYDRDLKFKEDQARRKLESLENEACAARVLTCEAERTMRAELLGLREQKANASKELLKENEKNEKLKQEHDELRQEKTELIEDLEGCKTTCDKKMQGQLDELMKKKETLLSIQEKVLECRCKTPVDEKVQVRRTPSLAAICMCAPEDNLLESCSCTSLRGRILSNLLADLFGGLQTELGGSGLRMPCQLLKCLEDQHNWDRPSVTKTNLRNFFSKLLKSELDIAIATSIEKYHARWVGETCADEAKMKPTLDDDLKVGWQQRAIERCAQKMACQLAEDLLRERSAQVEQQAKDSVAAGSSRCDPKPQDEPKLTDSSSDSNPKPKPTAMFPCLMPLNSPFNPAPKTKNTADTRQASETSPSAFWKQTIQDVTQLKLQIEDLKKDSIKKEDLKIMEKNIFKFVREASVIENEDPSAITRDTSKYYGERIKNETKISRPVSRDESTKTSNQNKIEAARRDESPKILNQNKIGAMRRDESPKSSNVKKLGATRRDESPKTSNQNKIGAIRRDESPKTSNQNKIGATGRDESLKTLNQNKIGGTFSDEFPKISNKNKLGAAKKDESPKTSNQNKFGANRRKDCKRFKKSSIYEKSTKQSKKQVHGQSYAVNVCLCGPRKNSKRIQNAHLNNSQRSSWNQKSLKDVTMPQSYIVKQTKPININLLSSELQENGSLTSESCNSNCKCFCKMPSNTSIDRLLQILASWNYDLVPQEKYIKNIKSSLFKFSKSTFTEAIRILTQNDSKNNLSTSPSSIKKQNVNDICEDAQMRTDKQDRSFLKQPATTESEYMGTVYLDKSYENNCKCITNIEENNQEKYEGGNKNIPCQYINTNICDCKIYREMQKDHKRSQTQKFLQVQSNQCQAVRSKDIPECNKFNSKPKSSNYINIQKEMKEKSETSNVPQKTELFSNNSEYFIKFLGVTLDDLSSNKETTRKLKTVDHNIDGLMIPKDKQVERPRKLPKLSNIEQFNSLMKPNDLTREKKYESKSNDCTKCEYKAKFEEFTSFMNNFFDNKLQENTHKEEVTDSQNVKHTDNTIESCVCCDSVNVDDSKDLEVNAFHLLEDHIKEKLEEFRSFSCKSKCISREEEEKIFSTILQRVKQVISDCANKMKCGCPGILPNKGSWDRAYGLLQEYLKIKIKRVQCVCVLNDRKDVILPEVLEEVCNLIENDFQRLKDICTCKNATETRSKMVRIVDHVLPPTELPEKDTNISQAKYNDVEVQKFSVITKFSKQNSNNSIILQENISSQVPPNLGMEAKSCDVMQPQSNKNARTTETDYITTDSKSNGVMYNTCDCCYNTDKVDIRKFSDLFGTKGVFVNLYAEQAINKSEFCDLPKIGVDQEPRKCLSAGGVNSMKPIPKEGMSENDENKLDLQNREDNTQTPRAPYIGYTVDCSCDDALGRCFCMKSIVQANNDKIDSLWKGFLIKNKKGENFPYIMHGIQNKNSDILVNCHSVSKDVLVGATSTTIILNNEDDVVLKYSHENLNLINHAANTVAESMSLETAYSNCESYPLDWNENPLPMTSERSNVVKLANSIYFPGQPIIDNDEHSYISSTATDPDFQKTCGNCACDKVPICHVKMLVKHIEKNFVESKCTCDSLISKVCPVHSKRFI